MQHNSDISLSSLQGLLTRKVCLADKDVLFTNKLGGHVILIWAFVDHCHCVKIADCGPWLPMRHGIIYHTIQVGLCHHLVTFVSIFNCSPMSITVNFKRGIISIPIYSMAVALNSSYSYRWHPVVLLFP